MDFVQCLNYIETLIVCRPFSVTPTTSTLAVGACMQVSVEFTPKKLGDHNKELIIYYETGECILLHACSCISTVSVPCSNAHARRVAVKFKGIMCSVVHGSIISCLCDLLTPLHWSTLKNSAHLFSGEEVYTQLYGSAVDVNVRLDRSSLTLDNTYLGLSSERSVVLHNRSNVVVHYQWKAFASELEENVRRQEWALNAVHCAVYVYDNVEELFFLYDNLKISAHFFECRKLAGNYTRHYFNSTVLLLLHMQVLYIVFIARHSQCKYSNYIVYRVYFEGIKFR